jgi:hypothetical protein
MPELIADKMEKIMLARESRLKWAHVSITSVMMAIAGSVGALVASWRLKDGGTLLTAPDGGSRLHTFIAFFSDIPIVYGLSALTVCALIVGIWTWWTGADDGHL